MNKRTLSFYLSKSHPDYKIAKTHATQARRLYNTLNKLKTEKSEKLKNPNAQTPVINQLGVDLTGNTEQWRKAVTAAQEIVLPEKVSQGVKRKLDATWDSVIKKRIKGEKAGNPGYKQDYCEVRYNIQAISRKKNLNRVVPTGWTVGFKLPNHIQLQQVESAELVSKPDGFELKVLYKNPVSVPVSAHKPDAVYAAGDLGLNNLITIVVPGGRPVIVDGKGLKSLNRFYNKKIAKLQSQREKAVGGEKERIKKHIDRLYYRRDKQFKHYLNTASNRIVDYLQGKGVQGFIVGWSDGFKHEVNMSKRNNQAFTYIPHAHFRDLLKRKCTERGIGFTIQEESYTSKASCMDHDDIPVYNPNVAVKPVFKGYRVKRGLYKSKQQQRFIHADFNGAWNILSKSKPSIRWSSGEVEFPEKLRIIF